MSETNLVTIHTWLPVFSGFYNTVWDPDCDLRDYIHCERPELKGWRWWEHYRHEEYEQAVVQACCEVLEAILPKACGIQRIQLEQLNHPREYNFENDNADVVVTVDLNQFTPWAQKLVRDHAPLWQQWLERKFKSRDGFISFYPHTPEEWAELTQNYTDFRRRTTRHDEGQMAFAQLLEFWANMKYDDPEMTLYYGVSSEVTPSSYVDWPEELKPRIESDAQLQLRW